MPPHPLGDGKTSLAPLPSVLVVFGQFSAPCEQNCVLRVVTELEARVTDGHQCSPRPAAARTPPEFCQTCAHTQ